MYVIPDITLESYTGRLDALKPLHSSSFCSFSKNENSPATSSPASCSSSSGLVSVTSASSFVSSLLLSSSGVALGYFSLYTFHRWSRDSLCSSISLRKS